jgi:hypothetical protein
MRKPLTRIILALLAAAAASQLAFVVMSWGMQRYTAHLTDQFSELVHGRSRHELLFVGQSRAHSAVKPRVIDRILKVDSYNAGIDGASAAEFLTVLDGYLVHHPAPSRVVLMVDAGTLDLQRRLWNPLLYFPYLDNPVVRASVRSAGYSPLFSAAALPADAGLRRLQRGNASRGYWQDRAWPGRSAVQGLRRSAAGGMREARFVEQGAKTISPDGLSTLQSVMDACRVRGIQLVLVVPPLFTATTSSGRTAARSSISSPPGRAESPRGVATRRLELCQRAELFSDPGHLNDAGAELYSTLLAGQLGGNGEQRKLVPATRPAVAAGAAAPP